MTGQSYPSIALGPVTVDLATDEAAREGARSLRYQIEQHVLSVCVAGLMALVTFPGHEGPRP